MTAGSIAVPTIVPLRGPVIGKFKNYIDTCTPVELRTGTFRCRETKKQIYLLKQV